MRMVSSFTPRRRHPFLRQQMLLGQEAVSQFSFLWVEQIPGVIDPLMQLDLTIGKGSLMRHRHQLNYLAIECNFTVIFHDPLKTPTQDLADVRTGWYRSASRREIFRNHPAETAIAGDELFI